MIVLSITRESVCFADDIEEHKIEVEIEEDISYEELFKNIISRKFLPSIIGNDVVWLLTHEDIDIISYHTKKEEFKKILPEDMTNKNWKNFHIKYFSSEEKYEKQ